MAPAARLSSRTTPAVLVLALAPLLWGLHEVGTRAFRRFGYRTVLLGATAAMGAGSVLRGHPADQPVQADCTITLPVMAIAALPFLRRLSPDAGSSLSSHRPDIRAVSE